MRPLPLAIGIFTASASEGRYCALVVEVDAVEGPELFVDSGVFRQVIRCGPCLSTRDALVNFQKLANVPKAERKVDDEDVAELRQFAAQVAMEALGL